MYRLFSKSWSLKLRETSGPVLACNGIDLPLTYMVCLKSSVNGTRKQKKTENTNKLMLFSEKKSQVVLSSGVPRNVFWGGGC
jgi:hypothetical protein